MSKRIHISGSACNMIGGLFQKQRLQRSPPAIHRPRPLETRLAISVLGWLLRFGRLMLAPKAVLTAKLLAAESQLVACTDAIERKSVLVPRLPVCDIS